MKTFIPTMLLALMFVSCDQERDVKKIRQVFSETKYDEDIIKSLPLYDSLKNIIISNIDTIFKYRNSRNFVFHSNGKDTTTVQEDANSYQFYYNYGEATALSYGTGANDQKLIDGVSVENMPAFIYPSIDNILGNLAKEKYVASLCGQTAQ